MVRRRRQRGGYFRGTQRQRGKKQKGGKKRLAYRIKDKLDKAFKKLSTLQFGGLVQPRRYNRRTRFPEQLVMY